MASQPTELLAVMNRFKSRLNAQDRAALKRLIDSYGASYRRLEPAILALANEIALMLSEGETVTIGKVYRLKRWLALSEQLADEIGAFSGLIRSQISPIAYEALGQATKDTKVLLSVLGAQNITTLPFERLPAEAIQTMLGFLAPDSPLYTRLKGLAPYTVDKIAETLLQGITEGLNPRTVARLIAGNAERSLGLTLTDALRTARTVQIWSYREATRANYVANEDVVTGWVWYAELDELTCLSCVANHGQEFPLDVELDDHYNGRCTMIPIVYGVNPVTDMQSGADWFEKQSAETQKAMMGPGKFEAWQAGKFEFSQLSTERPDETYGRMKFETSLKELIGEE